MVLVFKNIAERSKDKNYRSVRLFSVVSKVFDNLTNKMIVDHLEEHGIFF